MTNWPTPQVVIMQKGVQQGEGTIITGIPLTLSALKLTHARGSPPAPKP